MNMKLYNAALTELEQLHWHLHWNGGPDLWTAHLLKMFRDAVQDDNQTIRLGAVPIANEPPPPAA